MRHINNESITSLVQRAREKYAICRDTRISVRFRALCEETFPLLLSMRDIMTWYERRSDSLILLVNAHYFRIFRRTINVHDATSSVMTEIWAIQEVDSYGDDLSFVYDLEIPTALNNTTPELEAIMMIGQWLKIGEQ